MVEGYNWIVVTSANGARELLRRAVGRLPRIARSGPTRGGDGGADLVPHISSTQEGLLAELARRWSGAVRAVRGTRQLLVVRLRPPTSCPSPPASCDRLPGPTATCACSRPPQLRERSAGSARACLPSPSAPRRARPHGRRASRSSPRRSRTIRTASSRPCAGYHVVELRVYRPVPHRLPAPGRLVGTCTASSSGSRRRPRSSTSPTASRPRRCSRVRSCWRTPCRTCRSGCTWRSSIRVSAAIAVPSCSVTGRDGSTWARTTACCSAGQTDHAQGVEEGARELASPQYALG